MKEKSVKQCLKNGAYMGRYKIVFRATKRLNLRAVCRLFRMMGFYWWFSEADTAWYLRHALHVASAWFESRCVGLAVATGDGRIKSCLDLLLVDAKFQGAGIGSRLTQTIVEKVEKLRPYYFSLDVYQRRAERFYGRFGFVRNKGTWLLEHKGIADSIRKKHIKGRATRLARKP